jgi:hypothetical protein
MGMGMFLAAASLCAMDWPAQDAAVVRNFGFNDRGRPVLGTVFEGEGRVLAAESGEVIFSRTGAGKACRLPSPLGEWTALDHGDGFITIYSRCESEDGPGLLSPVDRGGPVASAGVSGWSLKKGFYFILYDRRERRWVNPSMIITPFPDSLPPQILGIQLRDAAGKPVESGKRSLSQGRYAIVVNTVDFMPAAPADALPRAAVPIAPYQIDCSVNGAEIGSLQFQTISARDGVLMVYRNGLVPAGQVYGPFPAFEAGEAQLNRGQAQLEIIVQDIAGNSRNALFRILVE